VVYEIANECSREGSPSRGLETNELDDLCGKERQEKGERLVAVKEGGKEENQRTDAA
jgi:hypothetical protein